MRGDCSYDKYEHDYIVYPYDVLIVERKKREDTAPVKRVELHLHTKLSSMDGFCDPGGIVKLAHRMGHPAIAITDHGGVRATRKPCWQPMTSTKKTRISSSSTAARPILWTTWCPAFTA